MVEKVIGVVRVINSTRSTVSVRRGAVLGYASTRVIVEVSLGTENEPGAQKQSGELL